MKGPLQIKVFVLIGLTFLLAGGYFHQRTASFIAAAEEAPGTVVSLERVSGGSYRPVVEWMDHTGTVRTLRPTHSSNPPRFFEGEPVTVLFDPSDPKYPVNARIKSLAGVWGVSLFFFGFGGIWLLITLATWYVMSKGGIVVFGEDNYPGRPDPDFPDRKNSEARTRQECPLEK